MGRHKYFELHEFTASDTARKKGIDNTPSFEIVGHLDELVSEILDPLRQDYGEPIEVTSGYRCEALNKAVGGVASSAHLLGYAADLTAKDMDAFKSFCQAWFTKTTRRFDQVIVERDKKGSEWVHVGLKNKKGEQRRQVFSMEK